MAIKVLINAERKVIGYYGADIELKTVPELPEQPETKMGFDNIPHYDEAQNKVIYKEVERPLTIEEEHQKKLEEMQEEIKAANERAEKAEKQAKIAKSQSLTALQAVGELAEERPSGTEAEVI